MAMTKDYLDYLNDSVGIAPASSQEELDCAQSLSEIFASRGLESSVEEFSTSALGMLPHGIAMVLMFLGVLLTGLGGVALFVGLVFVLLAAGLLWTTYKGNDVLSKIAPRTHSQNVIGFHAAEGDVEEQGRPIVVIAHYDTPRLDLLSRPETAKFKRGIAQVAPLALAIVCACSVLQLFVFLPDIVRRVLWIVGIIASLPLLAWGVSLVASRFMPYSHGAIDNKSSVAALLGVVDGVSGNVNPSRTFARPEAEGEVAYGDDKTDARDGVAQSAAPAVASVLEPRVRTAVSADAPAPAAPVMRREVEEVIGSRHGEHVLRALGILPESCSITYVEPEVRLVPVATPVTETVVPSVEPAVAEEGHSDTIAPQPFVAPAVDDDSEAPITQVAEEDFEADSTEEWTATSDAATFDVQATTQMEALSVDPDATNEMPAISTERIETERIDAEDAEEAATEAEHNIYASYVSVPQVTNTALDERMRVMGEVVDKVAGVLSKVKEKAAAGIESATKTVREKAAEHSTASTSSDDTKSEATEVSGDVVAEQATSDSPATTSQIQSQPADAEATQPMAATSDASSDETQPMAPLSSERIETSEVAAQAASEVSGATSITANLSQLEDGQNEDEGPTVENDQAGLSTMAQEDAETAADAPRPARKVPAVIDDPSWGKSSFTPARTDAGNVARRAALFDLPDPLAAEQDSLAPSATSAPSTATPVTPPAVRIEPEVATVRTRAASAPVVEDIQVLKASPSHASHAAHAESVSRRPSIFGRKDKKASEPMSEWLGVEEDFNAKDSGEKIGSWENFSDEHRGESWKGGAARSASGRNERGTDDTELRDAILSMGDDELRRHDIWFVATGASACAHAGAKHFLEANAKRLRGSFVINLESVGAGELTMLTREGYGTQRRADRRLVNTLIEAAKDLHIDLGQEGRTWADTEATPLMRKRLRGVTIMGLNEADLPAFSRTEDDVVDNVDAEQVEDVAALVTEVIRRS